MITHIYIYINMSNNAETAKTTIFNHLRNDPDKAEHLKVKIEGDTYTIVFSRPERKNAFTTAMYLYLTELIKKAIETPEVKFIVFRGSGGNYSTGNDLSNFSNEQINDFDPRLARTAVAEMLQDFCDTIIDSPKPIYAITEGKVLGFAFTTLALLDKVFAVEGSYFVAPLVKIFQGPEMASSYTFPKIFG